jgi:hypothetical protein
MTRSWTAIGFAFVPTGDSGNTTPNDSEMIGLERESEFAT